MTGFGSPCGACKFLRRKCARGCVFAPYFCHDQGATQFAAIHKVFGASNVSKLLMQIPINDRYEAVVSISYEAQARLQDPVYGCVSHIFALQQQVVNLQSQLTSLEAQAAMQDFSSVSTTTSIPQLQEQSFYNKLSPYQLDLLQTETSMPNASNGENRMNYENDLFESNLNYEHMYVSTNYSSSCQMEEDFQSFAYLHHA